MEEQKCEKIYGDCIGENSEYIKLISNDGHEFILKRSNAYVSGTIRSMFSGPGKFSEHEENSARFSEISSVILHKICVYFGFKIRYTNSSTEIPEFEISPHIALELLMAANFLDC